MKNIDDFLRRIAYVARGCPTAVLRDAVLGAAEQYCERTWLWVDEVGPETTVAETLEYQFFALDRADIVAIKSVELDEVEVSFTSVVRDTITLIAEPQADQELIAQAVLKPSLGSTRLPDFLYNEHWDAVSAGAKARLLDMQGTAWFNPQLADRARYEFERLWVPRARVEVAHRHGRPLSVTKRRFI